MRLPAWLPWTRRRPVDAEAPVLDALLAQAARAASYADRVQWVRDALRWIGQDMRGAHDGTGIARAHARVRFLLQLAARGTTAGTAARRLLSQLLADLDLEQLATELGILRRAGFIKELYERLLAAMLPRPDSRNEPAMLAARLLGHPGTMAWIDLLPAEQAGQVAQLFVDDASAANVRPQIAAALLAVASEAQAVGLAREVRRRVSDHSALTSPFGRLVAAAEAFLATPDATAHAELTATIEESERLLQTLESHFDEAGVSVDLVYRAERTRAQLARMRTLAQWIVGEEPVHVLRQVMNGVRRELSLRGTGALVSENMRLLSRRIAERNAETGEHYIARTRMQYRTMLAMSIGGGTLMTLAVYLKFGIGAAGLPLLWDGVAASLNYAGVFLMIALAHFTVATKQPAVTAPALAAKMRDLERPGRVDALVTEAAALVRSQAASVFGNVVAVAPCALAVAALWWLAVGGAPLSPDKARSVLAAHSVLGPSFVFAIYTGVLLWLSGLFGGWADNAFTLRRLHEAIASNRRLVRRLGAERARARADWWKANIAGLAGNVGLGMLLGLTPALFLFAGVPMEVRHVTLSTGQVAVASFTLGAGTLTSPPFWTAAGGLLLIGALNVGVSFALALRLAMRAVDISAADRARVYRAIRGRLLARPRDFIWPPPDAAAAGVAGEAGTQGGRT
jgi:site-specific recombinase